MRIDTMTRASCIMVAQYNTIMIWPSQSHDVGFIPAHYFYSHVPNVTMYLIVHTILQCYIGMSVQRATNDRRYGISRKIIISSVKEMMLKDVDIDIENSIDRDKGIHSIHLWRRKSFYCIINALM